MLDEIEPLSAAMRRASGEMRIRSAIAAVGAGGWIGGGAAGLRVA